MQTVTPFLWFDGNAQEAMHFYCSIFKDAKVLMDSPFSVQFELNGQTFMGLNGGPQFKFTEAVSFFVSCDTQEEVDYYWEKLSAEGEPGQCGWLKDKFGLSWQVVPKALGQLLSDPDPSKSQRVIDAMLKMNKIEVAALVRAYESG